MQANSGWAFGPEASVLAAELKDGAWQVSALGPGGANVPALRRARDGAAQLAAPTLAGSAGAGRTGNA